MMRASLLVAAAVMVFGAGAAGAQPEPVPTDDLSRFENATVASGLSVVVERAGERLLAGEDTTYTILARNIGENPSSVTIRVSLPPEMSRVRPGDGGELSEDGYVTFPVTIEPGEPVAFQLTGAYPVDDSADDPRVALTACAVDQADEPIVCATDLAEVQRESRTGLWLLLAAAVTVALAAAAGVGFLRWRHRRTAGNARVPA